MVEPGLKRESGGREGGSGTMKSLSSGAKAGQSVKDQLGEEGGGEVNGC